MTEYKPSDIFDFSFNQQPLQVANAFDSIMRDKIADRLDDYKEALAQNMFSSDNEEEEFDLDDYDISDEDIENLIDDEDLDFDEDDEDLDDLDLDLDDIEDITDEES